MVRQGLQTDERVQERIRELAEAKLTPVAIAMQMNCSVGTVYKYAGDIIKKFSNRIPKEAA